MKPYLPVGESFGFTQTLRANTSGIAFPQCVFDHFEYMTDDLLEIGSKSNEIFEGIRKRKGLKPCIQPLENYVDKLLRILYTILFIKKTFV
jgi:elongation factor 2